MSETKGYSRTISTAEFTETPRVSLEQPTGDVFVEAWDRPEVEITTSDPDALFDVAQNGSEILVHNRPGTFKLVNFVEPAANELKGIGINLEPKNLEKMASRVERSVERSMRRMGKGFNLSVDLGRWMGGRDYHIKVPYNCNLSLRTSSGDINVMGVTGTSLLHSTSGDIHVSRASGNLLVNSASGDIRIGGLEGKLGARSASGDIRAEKADLKELNITTASGDIDLDLLSVPESNWEIKTVSGEVTVYLPGDTRLTADIRTLSGEINCGFPRSQVNYTPGHGRSESKLQINGGGSKVNLSTVSGDITVKPRMGEGQSDQGAYTTDLSRMGQNGGASGDITRPEGYVSRQQAELEILQALERGEITSQDAMQRLSALER